MPGPREPGYREFLRARRAGGGDRRPGTLNGLRAEHAADLARSPRMPLHRVRDLTVDGAAGPLPARLYVPVPGEVPGLLVYFHGGGWVLGDVDAYDPVVRALAAASGVAVVSVGYRRPPRFPFPAATDDAVAALASVRALAADGGLPVRESARIGVAGDSAGGQIAAVAAWRHARAGTPPAVQVLVYPAVDLREVPPSPPDPDGLPSSGGDIGRALAVYLGDADARRPEVSPLLVPDPETLPPTIMAVAEHDRLAAQGAAYAARLRAAGVPVRFLPGDGLDHGYLGWSAFAAPPAAELASLGAEIRAAFTDPTPHP
ncbi:alpha/beta hydrolase [Actinomadura flavalba]|uniref:alpha/beta hydrolase n=1 Tax=Actinomadura flavalba TaxID=1120938 RepID=UPI000382F0D9|nr:alpha/beta hydrolase [Actinomadura flavalba]